MIEPAASLIVPAGNAFLALANRPYMRRMAQATTAPRQFRARLPMRQCQPPCCGGRPSVAGADFAKDPQPDVGRGISGVGGPAQCQYGAGHSSTSRSRAPDLGNGTGGCPWARRLAQREQARSAWVGLMASPPAIRSCFARAPRHNAVRAVASRDPAAEHAPKRAGPERQ